MYTSGLPFGVCDSEPWREFFRKNSGGRFSGTGNRPIASGQMLDRAYISMRASVLVAGLAGLVLYLSVDGVTDVHAEGVYNVMVYS